MLTLADIYGEGTFLAPRLMEEAEGHIPGDRNIWEFSTGVFLTIAGGMPAVVHASVATEEAASIIRKGGLEFPAEIQEYETREEYIEKVDRLSRDGLRAAFIYSQPSDPPRETVPVVANSALEFLNNKRNLRKIAPKPSLLPLVEKRQAFGWSDGFKHVPVVAKLATDNPNAGGMGVRICRKRRDAWLAARKFSKHGTYYFEEFLEVQENWCAQFAIMPDGSIQYLGTTQQICSEDGAHLGSKITKGLVPHDELQKTGETICRSVKEYGYKGIVGLDFIAGADQKPYLVDLNCRPVASTAFLLNRHAIFRAAGANVSRLAFCSFEGHPSDFLRIFGDLIDQKVMVALCVSCNRSDLQPESSSFLHLAFQGESNEAVDRVIREACSRGLSVFGAELPT